MEFTKGQMQNYFNLVGKLGSVDIKDGVTKNGVDYIRGTIIVEANDSEFKVTFFEMKTWKNGTMANPKFEEIKSMSNGQLVSFSCSLEENKFAGRDGIISNEQLTLGFINKPSQTDEPGLTFDIVGVVTSPLKDVMNEKGDLIKHTIKIGQGQYRADQGFSIVELSVNPNQTGAVNYMRDNYTLNKTIRVSGRGSSTIETREVEVETLFGTPNIEIYQNHVTDYVIEGGLEVNDGMIYSEEAIEFLKKATASYEEQLISDSKSKPAANVGFGGNTSTPPANDGGGINSLLGI